MIWNYSAWLLPFVVLKRIYSWSKRNFIMQTKTFLFSKIWRMSCGRGVIFSGSTIIRSYDKNAIQIKDDVVFNSNPTDNLVGLSGATIICAGKGAKIEIGEHSGFSSVVINARERIAIGNHVKVGGNVRIFDHDFHPLSWADRRAPEKGGKTKVKPVVIDDDVFIGTNVIILKGTHIGARSIIAAGSVVMGLDVPPDSMVRGNPAVCESRKSKE
jgi:acetyltransferase-like isoleucine patch superfamily enzyme